VVKRERGKGKEKENYGNGFSSLLHSNTAYGYGAKAAY